MELCKVVPGPTGFQKKIFYKANFIKTDQGLKLMSDWYSDELTSEWQCHYQRLFASSHVRKKYFTLNLYSNYAKKFKHKFLKRKKTSRSLLPQLSKLFSNATAVSFQCFVKLMAQEYFKPSFRVKLRFQKFYQLSML